MNLKRGAKIFLACEGRVPSGPFKWTLIREWIALGFVAPNARIRADQLSDWTPASDFECLVSLPDSMRKPDSVIMYYRSAERTRFPSGPRQHAYLRALGCPFDASHFDKHLARRVISQLEEAFPERASNSESDACEEELERLFREAPATDRQRTYLRSVGADVPDDLSKAQASQLISPPTEGQLRRLRFYEIPVPRFLTKDEASDLIESFVRAHPEGEEKYQAWKQQQAADAAQKPWWKLW